MPYKPGDPWPDSTYPGGAVNPAWSGYVRLVAHAQIAAGHAFHIGQHNYDRLNDGNVMSQAGGLPLEAAGPGVGELAGQQSGLWVDVSCDLVDLEVSLGASSTEGGILTKSEAGTLSATLFDPTGKYDPLNPTGPYSLGGASRLIPGAPFRVFAEVINDPLAATVTVTRVPLFTGTVDRWSADWATAPGDRFAKLVATDETKRWVKYDAPEQPPQGDGDTTLARLNRIKTFHDWPGSVTQWGTSPVTLQATTLAQTAWELANRTADDELGFVFFPPQPPTATWAPGMVLIARSIWSTRGTPAIHIGCQPAGSPDTYFDIATEAQPLAFDILLRNTVYASRTGGTMQTVANAQSVARFGAQAIQRSDLGLADDAQVAAWALLLVNHGSFPHTVLDHVVLQPAAYVENAARTVGPWQPYKTVLQIGLLSSTVHVVWTGAGYVADVQSRVVGIKHSITVDAWETTWQTVPAVIIPAVLSFHLGPHANDRLDAGFLLGG